MIRDLKLFLLERIRRLALRAGLARPDHLWHADGTAYMRRWWILGKPGKKKRAFALRLHHIATADLDRHMHDHPWPFVSLVLKGFYFEKRPIERGPCFAGEQELHYTTVRHEGDIAYRGPSDRHRISTVGPEGCWTLILIGPITHWWGFYTPLGKIHWRDYESVHSAHQAPGRPS